MIAYGPGKIPVGRIAIENHGMVEFVYDLLFDNGLQVSKIHDHPVLDVVGIFNRSSYDGDVKVIAVPMDVLAFAVVAV